MTVLYNGDFKNMVSRKTRLKFDKITCNIKKNSFSSIPHPYILPVLRSIEILQFVFFHMLILHDFNLDLSALCALLTLIVNN